MPEILKYALPQTCVLCTFHRNHTVFAIWWWFEASATISWSGVLKSEILPNLLRMVKIGSLWLHVAYCACYYLDYRRISWPASPTPHPPLSPGFPNPETPSPARISNKFLEALSLQVMKKKIRVIAFRRFCFYSFQNCWRVLYWWNILKINIAWRIMKTPCVKCNSIARRFSWSWIQSIFFKGQNFLMKLIFPWKDSIAY